jgi:hypothetical protein
MNCLAPGTVSDSVERSEDGLVVPILLFSPQRVRLVLSSWNAPKPKHDGYTCQRHGIDRQSCQLSGNNEQRLCMPNNDRRVVAGPSKPGHTQLRSSADGQLWDLFDSHRHT